MRENRKRVRRSLPSLLFPGFVSSPGGIGRKKARLLGVWKVEK